MKQHRYEDAVATSVEVKHILDKESTNVPAQEMDARELYMVIQSKLGLPFGLEAMGQVHCLLPGGRSAL
jgi:hypothetical protein